MLFPEAGLECDKLTVAQQPRLCDRPGRLFETFSKMAPPPMPYVTEEGVEQGGGGGGGGRITCIDLHIKLLVNLNNWQLDRRSRTN